VEFYQGVLGGSLTLNTFGEYGAQDSPDAKKIMHGMLETPSGHTLMGADTPSGMEYNPGTNIAVSLSGDARFADIDDQVEACRRVFASDTRWTVVRGSDLEEGESQGLPVWSRHVGDPTRA